MKGGTTARGNLAQDHAKAILEQDGYLVEMAVPQVRIRWNRDTNQSERKPTHDFFGCIDLIAVKPQKVRFVQVTHPNGTYERINKIRTKIPAALLSSLTLSWELWEWTGSEFRIRFVDAPEVKA